MKLIIILIVGTFFKSYSNQDSQGICVTHGTLLQCNGIKERSHFVEVLISLNRDQAITNLTILNSEENVVLSLFENIGHSRLHDLEEISVINSSLQQVPRPVLEVLEEASRLKLLNLSANYISEIPIQILRFPTLLTIDLSSNNLDMIEGDVGTNLKLALYENVQLSCDWLLSHFLQLATESDRKRLICNSSNGVFNQMTIDQVSSVLKTPICNDCLCSANNQALTVNCSSKGLSSVPQSLPYDTKVVVLSNNMINDLLFNETENWNNVLYLFLNNNTIDNLSGFVSGRGSEILKNLVLLQLESNRLRSINGSLLNPKIEKLFLKDNPWKCDCELMDFRSWLEKHVDRVNEIDQIKCASSPYSSARNGVHAFLSSDDQDIENGNSIIISLKPDRLCPELKELVFEEDPVKNMVLDCISVTLLLLTTVVLAKVFYDSRWQKRTGKLPKMFRLNK